MQLQGFVLAVVLSSWPLDPSLEPSPHIQSQQVEREPRLARALADWRRSYGASWYIERDPYTAMASLIYGGSAPAFLHPRTDAEWIAVALAHVAATGDLHGIDSGTLRPDARAVRLLPLGRLPQGVDKVAVKFRQYAADIAVEDGFFNVLMSTRGDLIAAQSQASPYLDQVSLSMVLAASEAQDIALSRFVDRVGFGPNQPPSTPQPVVVQVVERGRKVPRLAWRVEVRWAMPTARPDAWRYWVDGNTGKLLREDPLVCSFDVGGTLCAWATPGTLPDTAANPEITMEVPYARIEAPGGLVTYSDRFGNWSFPGQPGPLDVTFTFVGAHVAVDDTAGDGNYIQTEDGLTGSSNTIVMNAVRDEFTTAEANAYVVANRVGNYIRDVECDGSTACDETIPDATMTAYANETTACAPTSNGVVVHLGREFSGSCRNAAYSTVIAHEVGHVLNLRYGTAHGGGTGVNEGTADIWAMYVFDTEHVGEAYYNSQPYVRTGGAANMSPFCGDLVDVCCGDDEGVCEAHSEGLKWMGAAWKVRQALNNRYDPDEIGDMIADTLFVSWMNAFAHPQEIDAAFQIEWLLLDDNNANLDDGTPNRCEVVAGFSAHGFPEICLPGTCP